MDMHTLRACINSFIRWDYFSFYSFVVEGRGDVHYLRALQTNDDVAELRSQARASTSRIVTIYATDRTSFVQNLNFDQPRYNPPGHPGYQAPSVVSSVSASSASSVNFP